MFSRHLYVLGAQTTETRPITGPGRCLWSTNVRGVELHLTGGCSPKSARTTKLKQRCKISLENSLREDWVFLQCEAWWFFDWVPGEVVSYLTCKFLLCEKAKYLNTTFFFTTDSEGLRNCDQLTYHEGDVSQLQVTPFNRCVLFQWPDLPPCFFPLSWSFVSSPCLLGTPSICPWILGQLAWVKCI